jgi:dGTPase
MSTLSLLATSPAQSRGRLFIEPADPIRSVFQRDRDRIVHSGAFRRLKYKTQVFVNHEGDHFRTRLTHSLEVAQIARTLCRALGLDEDLGEALALAHDFGHTPFGHAGEDALNAVMQPYGGFDHNEQTLRIVTDLEHRYAKFPGLNLSWEMLEGLVKHNGPLMGTARPYIAAVDAAFPLDLDRWPGLEAQVASLADDIAYSSHDLDVGLRAGMFTTEELMELPVVGVVFIDCARRFADATPEQQRFEAVRRLMRVMIVDLLATTKETIERLGLTAAEDVRAAPEAAAVFSVGMTEALMRLKAFLMQRMYRHWRVNRMASKAGRLIRDVFGLLMAEPQCLPPDWQQRLIPGDTFGNARHIANYIAGMTDRFAQKEHQRLFDVSGVGSVL